MVSWSSGGGVLVLFGFYCFAFWFSHFVFWVGFSGVFFLKHLLARTSFAHFSDI